MGSVRCAVLGDPIAHSLSPVLHRAAYDATGLDWSYDAVRVPAGGLADAPGRARRVVARALTDHAAEARGDAARRHGLAARRAWSGRRTRWSWSMARCTPTTPTSRVPPPRSGSGTTARSPRPPSSAPVPRPRRSGWRCATSALARCCCSPATRPGRRRRWPPSNGHPDGPRVEVGSLTDGLPSGEVLVSTIPADAQDADLVARCADAAVVFEVVYDPWPTPLAAAAAGSGAGQRARPARAPGGAAVLDLHRPARAAGADAGRRACRRSG